MASHTQFSIQSTAGAVPVRNEKGNVKKKALFQRPACSFDIHNKF